ncbi:MAG: TIGR03862 family flavoprotein [Paracoccus sp. (in: a-proteobacteria)]
MKGALVIGAGPAGLMAAEELARAGHPVTIAESMPTPARKFLMAGKSGLNLTRNEPLPDFMQNFSTGKGGCLPLHPQGYFSRSEHVFGPSGVMKWAEDLGIALFTGSTKRVFPAEMKASPLLRAWLGQLRDLGVRLQTRWHWQGFADRALTFTTPEGQQVLRPEVCVLALGGASWPKLGSTAQWVPWLQAKGVEVAPFQPANVGFRVNWSKSMSRHFGQPVKGTAIQAGNMVSRGEWVISCSGMEGGGIYAVSAAIRDGARVVLDLVPDLGINALESRFSRPRGKLSVGNWLRRVLGDPVKVALLLEWGQSRPLDAQGWAAHAKALPIRHDGPMGIERAISSAGGIRFSALNTDFGLHALPGTFVAGEMLDWEAPTGGYLLTHCLGMGRYAGRSAAGYLAAARR